METILPEILIGYVTVGYSLPSNPCLLVNVSNAEELGPNWTVLCGRGIAIFRLSTQLTQRLDLPPLRYLPQLRIDQPVGNRSQRLRRQIGFPALQLGADRTEVHEPVPEDGPCHLLQGLVHPPVQLNLVVQGAEDVGDGLLLGEGRDLNLNGRELLSVETTSTMPCKIHQAK